MIFQKEITNWYSVNKRDLPWRNTKNPYNIWLSEIILQQTQVKQGLPYYERFVTKYPTVFDLAKASEEDVLKLWQGLGYYSRARNLHTTAKHIAYELDGVFPKNHKNILKLKGVGDYTASAIASIAFNESHAVVDGNVYRVLSRYFGIDTPINTSDGIKKFKALATDLINVNDPGNYNQAIMEFGARQCRPKNPDCNSCPLTNSCEAHRRNIVSELPVKLKKTKIKTRYINFLVCFDKKGRTLIEKRTKKGIWRNLYQFPMIESNESITAESFNKLVLKHSFLKNLKFDYSLYNEKDKIHKLSHQHLFTKFWIIELDELPKDSISIKDLTDYPTPVLISNFIDEFNFETV
ncbi:A/G-specific adenine glycosylase [Winogradskyella alexanderae]|uniref:Adenine DNA glycosylase n=1 Tax=Winogradskyella alexanderae TaxID=2877123 RepID=A0ABS7XRM1_9FLAO|nr:A/G-specific adenine glycosylase [Winogradskyella alexanderae]MCA0131486.1 A/G-specific adenine glycosylase [Winogradskyella alexanderae]